jgi:hypothetical protein
MDPRYCANVRAFILRQADDLLAKVLSAFAVTPEALGLREGDTARSWLESRPLLIALADRAALTRRSGPRRAGPAEAEGARPTDGTSRRA